MRLFEKDIKTKLNSSDFSCPKTIFPGRRALKKKKKKDKKTRDGNLLDCVLKPDFLHQDLTRDLAPTSGPPTTQLLELKPFRQDHHSQFFRTGCEVFEVLMNFRKKSKGQDVLIGKGFFVKLKTLHCKIGRCIWKIENGHQKKKKKKRAGTPHFFPRKWVRIFSYKIMLE